MVVALVQSRAPSGARRWRPEIVVQANARGYPSIPSQTFPTTTPASLTPCGSTCDGADMYCLPAAGVQYHPRISSGLPVTDVPPTSMEELKAVAWLLESEASMGGMDMTPRSGDHT